MVKVWLSGVALIISMIVGLGDAAAQEIETAQPRPLLMSAVRDDQFIISHDLYWLSNGEWEAVTTDGYQGGFSLSPSGFIMAVQSVPDAVRPVIEGGASWLAGAVWDMRLLDMTTGESRLIAGQPPELTVDSATGTIRNGITRSLPVWSPDGTALAWTEQDYPAQGTARLLNYDLITRETRVLDAKLPQATLSADGLPRDLSWGESGLVVFTNDPETGVETLRFYDPQSGLQQTIPVPDGSGEPWRPLFGPLWATVDGADEQVIVQAGPWTWWRVAPVMTGVAQFCSGLEQVSAANPQQSLQLVWDSTLAQTESEWRLVSGDDSDVTALDASQAQDMVLSPQGERAAWVNAGAVSLFDGGEITAVELPAGLSNPVLYWGPGAWRIDGTTSPECAAG